MARFFIAGTNLAGGMAILRGRDAEHVHVLRLRPHGWEFGTRAEFLNGDACTAFSRSEGGDAR